MKKRRNKPRAARIPARAPSYGALLKLVKVALCRHLKALCKMRPRQKGEPVDDYDMMHSDVEGYMTGQEVEACRKLLRDLHQLTEKGEPESVAGGLNPATMTDEELKEATKILAMG